MLRSFTAPVGHRALVLLLIPALAAFTTRVPAAQPVAGSLPEAPHAIYGGLPPLATPPEASTTNQPASTFSQPPAPYTRPHTRSTRERTPGQLDGAGAIYCNGLTDVDSTEAAIVVFILAGTVVVVSAVIYGGMLLTNVALRPEEAVVWGETSGRAMFFSGASQQGYMAGGALALGLEDGDSDVGVVIEGGHLDADVVTLDDQEVSVAGGYVMAGPVLRYWFDSSGDAPVFEAELLVGSASNYDLISRASFALTWSLVGPWRAGLRLGALYLDVADDDGPVWKAGSDFNLLGGLETSVRF